MRRRWLLRHHTQRFCSLAVGLRGLARGRNDGPVGGSLAALLLQRLAQFLLARQLGDARLDARHRALRGLRVLAGEGVVVHRLGAVPRSSLLAHVGGSACASSGARATRRDAGGARAPISPRSRRAMLILSSTVASSLLASSLRNSIPTQVDRLVSALELQPVGVDDLELPGGARARVRSYENSDSRVAWAAAVKSRRRDQFAGSLRVWLAVRRRATCRSASILATHSLWRWISTRLDAAFDASRDASGEYAAPTSREVRVREPPDRLRRRLLHTEARECERARRRHRVDQGGARHRGPTAVRVRGQLQCHIRPAARRRDAAVRRRRCRDGGGGGRGCGGPVAGWLDEAEPATWMDTRLIFARDSQVRRQLAVAERAALEGGTATPAPSSRSRRAGSSTWRGTT